MRCMTSKWLGFALVIGLGLSLGLPQAVAEPAVSTGAGYQRMVEQVAELYKAQTNKPLTEMYGGNIGQVLEQLKAGSGVSVVISDQATLDASDVEFAAYQPLGEAVLVLAWRKGLSLESPFDLLNDNIQSIGYPDRSAAIYGRAAVSWLTATNLLEQLEPKLNMLSTVPQVFSYLISGDLDAGFVNVAVIRSQGDQVGGSLEIDSGYEPLFLVAGVVKGFENDAEVMDFVNFLGSPEARAIYSQHGLQAR